MTPEEREKAMAIRVDQLRAALTEAARAADRESSDTALAMGHDGGRGWNPDAHLEPIVAALARAHAEGLEDGLREAAHMLDHVPAGLNDLQIEVLAGLIRSLIPAAPQPEGHKSAAGREGEG